MQLRKICICHDVYPIKLRIPAARGFAVPVDNEKRLLKLEDVCHADSMRNIALKRSAYALRSEPNLFRLSGETALQPFGRLILWRETNREVCEKHL